jgi:hypothetical protein
MTLAFLGAIDRRHAVDLMLPRTDDGRRFLAIE